MKTSVKTGVPKQLGIKKAFLMLGLAVTLLGGMAVAAVDVEEGGGGHVVSFSFSVALAMLFFFVCTLFSYSSA